MSFVVELVGGPRDGERLKVDGLDLPNFVYTPHKVPDGPQPLDEWCERYKRRTGPNASKSNPYTGHPAIPTVWLYDYTPKENA